MADTTANQLFDIWKKQLEEGTQAWTRLVSQAPPTAPPDPFSFWRPVLDQGLQAWAKLFAQSPVSPDLHGQWKQFLDQRSEERRVGKGGKTGGEREPGRTKKRSE